METKYEHENTTNANLLKSDKRVPLKWPEPSFFLPSEVKDLSKKLVKILLKTTDLDEAAALDVSKKWIKMLADETTFV